MQLSTNLLRQCTCSNLCGDWDNVCRGKRRRVFEVQAFTSKKRRDSHSECVIMMRVCVENCPDVLETNRTVRRHFVMVQLHLEHESRIPPE